MSKLCLRCEKSFSRLDIHTKRKKICKRVKLDISYEDMMQNYDDYYMKYFYKGGKYDCKHCLKSFSYQSGLSRHKKECKKSIILNSIIHNTENNDVENNDVENNVVPPMQTGIGNIYITGDVNIEIDNKKMVIQNYGNEVLPDISNFIDNVYKTMNDSLQIEGHKLLGIFFECLFILTAENRSLVIRSPNDGRIDVRKNNNWKTVQRKDMKDNILSLTKQNLLKVLDLANKHGKDFYGNRAKRILENFNTYIIHDYNETILYNHLMGKLITSRDLLKEHIQLSKLIEAIELNDVERQDYINKKGNEYLVKAKIEDRKRKKITRQPHTPCGTVINNVNSSNIIVL